MHIFPATSPNVTLLCQDFSVRLLSWMRYLIRLFTL